MTRQRTEHLRLPLMPAHNQSRLSTAFTTSIEARTGVTTGISAADRARTIAVAALRYFLVILRSLFLKGVGLETFWPEALSLLGWGVGILGLALARSSKRSA